MTNGLPGRLEEQKKNPVWVHRAIQTLVSYVSVIFLPYKSVYKIYGVYTNKENLLLPGLPAAD